MKTIVNRILNFDHWEIFMLFIVVLFIPISVFSNNFFNVIFKALIILLLSYVYYFTVFVFLSEEILRKGGNIQEIKTARNSLYFRIIVIISGPILFLLDNAIYDFSLGKDTFASFVIMLIPLNIISLIFWLYFLNFISKSLYHLENGIDASVGKYFGYIIAFMFIPIGIFIVQPILNKIYTKIQQENSSEESLTDLFDE